MKNYLNFETDIKNLETELDKLKDPYNQDGISEVDTSKITDLQNEIDKKLKDVYSNLDAWQTTLVARHEDRPKSKFFIDNLFDEFISLSGDRFYGEDKSVICGFGKFNSKSVLVIGQEKGENLDTRIERNFGMMRPEGYRKTIRLMNLANKFKIPIINFVDTPGAYPGVGAEERGQAEAIAKSIECSMQLTVPTLSIIIGEGGSGGAIALASSSKVLMLENAIYSVISPEGCATILWRDPTKTLEAAKAMKLSAKDLLKLEIIDEIIPEPLGGAHRDKDLILDNVRSAIDRNLSKFLTLNEEEILNQRKNKFLDIGRNKGFSTNAAHQDKLTVKQNLLLGAWHPKAKEELTNSLKKVYKIFPKLETRSNQLAKTMSGGEQQMLAIARGMMGLPKLLMVDEPFLGLSPMVMKDLIKIFKNIVQEGISILFVEQNVRLALSMADRGYVLESGRLVIDGKSEDLVDNEKVTKVFLGN